MVYRLVSSPSNPKHIPGQFTNYARGACERHPGTTAEPQGITAPGVGVVDSDD